MVLGLGAVALSPASAMQIGGHGGGGYAYGIRGAISQPSNFTHGNDAKVYWIYATFPDGTFFQAGYVDASQNWGTDACHTGFGTFVTALRNGQNLFPDLYNLQNCGLTGTHYFTLEVTSVTGSTITWRWKMSGNFIGPSLTLPISQNRFTRTNGGFVSEIVHVGTISQSAGFPVVNYAPAIQYKNGSSVWVDAANGIELQSGDRTCRYAIKILAANNARTGLDIVINPTNCYVYGATLW